MREPAPSAPRQVTTLVTGLLLLINLAFVLLLAGFSHLLDEGARQVAGESSGLAAVLQGQAFLRRLVFPFVVLSSITFTVWIYLAMIIPLRRISAGLRDGSPEKLHRLVREPTELGHIARLVVEGFTARDGLRREIAIRQEIEERLRQSESNLNAMALEREAFLNELHDGLIQDLYGSGLRLEEIRGSLQGADPRSAEALHAVTADINASINRLRGSLHRSARLIRDIVSLEEALDSLVQRFKRHGGVDFHLEIEPGVSRLVPAAQATELHAICAEGLMNALRHSGARRVEVTLRREGAQIVLRIRDDGRGLPPEASGGLGMASMRRRAESIGAQWSVESSEATGTTLALRLPQPGAQTAA